MRRFVGWMSRGEFVTLLVAVDTGKILGKSGVCDQQGVSDTFNYHIERNMGKKSRMFMLEYIWLLATIMFHLNRNCDVTKKNYLVFSYVT